ncbi:hypothetical protein [Pseudonocardia nigra]|uniref:hypothetical protein n=1 Tax=Pseudonocardia nigra TaxID=1921578 RepID=UPI001FE2677A|nr:hypothetical protein [Pseudonocardia nigra]
MDARFTAADQAPAAAGPRRATSAGTAAATATGSHVQLKPRPVYPTADDTSDTAATSTNGHTGSMGLLVPTGAPTAAGIPARPAERTRSTSSRVPPATPVS